MHLTAFEEQIFFATLRIEAFHPSSGEKFVGTGFLIQEPVPGVEGRGFVVPKCDLVQDRAADRVATHRPEARRVNLDADSVCQRDYFLPFPRDHRFEERREMEHALHVFEYDASLS